METYKHIAEPARLSLSVSLATALPHLAARDRFPLAHSIATGACDDSGRAARASTSACAYGKCATSRTPTAIPLQPRTARRLVATSLANGRGQLCENCASRIRHRAAAHNERNHADKTAIGLVRRGIFAFSARDSVLPE